MKPRIFIGSSVEGLNVAYAIQQNLIKDAESTVWDQGIFELSSTTIESLDKTLEEMDFGIFVFTSDDIVIMRGEETPSIRDNVLFEIGLFIGKLGRNRVFFVIPEGSQAHIPTDLLGVTPGKYDPNREDGSFQAATGPVCNQIRIQTKKLGCLHQRIETEKADTSKIEEPVNKIGWFDDLLQENYSNAREKLEKSISSSAKSGEDLIRDKAWLAFIGLKENSNSSIVELCTSAEENFEKTEIVDLICNMFEWCNFKEKAIEIASNAFEKNAKDIKVGILLATYYIKDDNIEMARITLYELFPTDNPEVAIELFRTYEENDSKAMEVLHSAYKNCPNHEILTYTYAEALENNKQHKEALYLYNYLTITYPQNTAYWQFLSNNCLYLDFYDSAMRSSKRAEELSESKEAWILHSIGNLFNNKGFYSEAISWLNKGLNIDPQSEYGHDRLSSAIKLKNIESEEYNKACTEGRKLLRNLTFGA